MVRTDQRQLTSFDEQLQPIHDSSLQPMIACFRGLVMVLVYLLLVQTFLAEGLLTRFVVSGASMSPTLHGAHFELRCPECATVFCVETEEEVRPLPNESPLRWGICPACAFAQVPVSADARRPGNRIYVNRAALSLRAIRRWDVVLFRSPEDGRLTIKRVVGLPGETLEIRDGDIFINGQIAVKSLAVQRAMRIPVLYGRWEMQPGKFPETCELIYHPIRNVPHNSPLANPVTARSTAPSPAHCILPSLTTRNSPLAPRPSPLYGVTNQLCENQWRIEQPGGIFPVRDLMLELEWRPEASKLLGVMARSGEHRFEVLFDPSQNSIAVTPGNIQRQYDFHRGTNGTYKITVSLFDRYLLVAVNDVIIVGMSFDDLAFDGEARSAVNEPPFAVGFSDIGFSQEEQQAAIERQIKNLCVWHDVYYTPPLDNASTTAVAVPADCYYLLGDNSGFSADSRHWNEPCVAHRYINGIVMAFPGASASKTCN